MKGRFLSRPGPTALILLLLAACTSPLQAAVNSQTAETPPAQTEPLLPAQSPTAFSTPTHTPPPATEPIPTETAEPNIQATLVTMDEPQVLQSSTSPDGSWRAEVLRWDCVLVGPEEMAYEELRLVNLQDGSEAVLDTQLQACGGLGAAGLEAVDWSQNGRYLYTSRSREGGPDGLCWYWYRDLQAYELETGETTALRGGPLSPDGSTMAFWEGKDLVLWSLEEGEIARQPAALPGLEPGPVAWAPGGKALAYIQNGRGPCAFGESALVRLDIPSLEPGDLETSVLLESEQPSFTGLAWETADTFRLTALDRSQWTYHAGTQELEPAEVEPTPTPQPTTAQGTVLFARESDLWLAGLDGQGLFQPLTAGGVLNWPAGEDFFRASNYRQVFLSPDGRRASFSRTGLEMMVLDLEQGTLTQIPGPGSSWADWSPDGGFLAFFVQKRIPDGVEDLFIYDVDSGDLQPVARLVEMSGLTGVRKDSLAWSPDGQRLGFVCGIHGDAGQLCSYKLTQEKHHWGDPIPVQDTEFNSLWVCWAADGTLTQNPEQGRRCVRSGEPGRRFWVFSPDGANLLEMERQINGDAFRSSDPVLLRMHSLASGKLAWEMELGLPLRRAAWSLDGSTLFLDDDGESSPVWHMPADGSSEPEIWLDDGYLVGVTPLSVDSSETWPPLQFAGKSSLPATMKGYELYSWEEAGEWYFTLITGTNRSKTLEEITTEENQVRGDGWVKVTVQGSVALQTVLGQLPDGESVFWAGGPGIGPAPADGSLLALPPEDTIKGIQAYCQSLEVNLVVIDQ